MWPAGTDGGAATGGLLQLETTTANTVATAKQLKRHITQPPPPIFSDRRFHRRSEPDVQPVTPFHACLLASDLDFDTDAIVIIWFQELKGSNPSGNH
jgi:hypothetical protein